MAFATDYRQGLRVEPPRVSIVVVTWNAEAYVRRCFRSLCAHSAVPYELIVVDNASEDPLRRWLKYEESGGRIQRLILNDENRMWAAGANQGLAAARSDTPYLLLLNPDTEALTADWLARLIALMESAPDVGIVGTERVWMPVGPVFGGADGHCLLMRRAVLAATGGIDEAFPWWGGGLKLNAAAFAKGFRHLILDDPVLAHFEGRSNAERKDPIAGVVPDYEKLLRDVGLQPRPAGLMDRLGRRWEKSRRRRRHAALRKRVRAVVAAGGVG